MRSTICPAGHLGVAWNDNAADIGSGHTTLFREVGAITHQTADGSGLANLIAVESIEV